MKRNLAIVIACLALAACSGDGNSNPVSAGNAQPSTTDSSPSEPEPTMMTAKQAGNYYLTTVCPTNVALYDLQEYVVGKQEWEIDLAQTRQKARDLARSYREAAASLQDPPLKWPRNVQGDVLAVSKTDLARVTYYNQVGSVGSFSELVSLGNEQPTSGDNRAAEQVRLTLGLAAAGKCPDWAEKAKEPTLAKP